MPRNPPLEELLEPIMALDPIAIYHFGSSARDPLVLRPDSDLDFGFLAARSNDPYRVFLAAQAIARRAGRETDLVDLRRVGDVFKVQVIGCGQRVFTAAGMEAAVAEFEMLVFAGYARLNEERAQVLQRALAS